MIDVTLLGTAALFPTPERALTAAALTCAGRTILFDCGEGTQTAARRWGVSPLRVDLIALTHYHGDHIFGLPGLMQTMNSLGRTAPLSIAGPEGLEDALAPILALAGAMNYLIRRTALPKDGIAMKDIAPGWPDRARLTPFATRHRVSSQGYAFELGRAGKFMPERARALDIPTPFWGKLQRGETVTTESGTFAPDDVLGPERRGLKFAFSGDTAPCDALEHAAKDADLLICEATYGLDEQAALAAEHGHMTFAQAAQAAARAGAKRLWLTHYSQMIEDPAECLPNALAHFANAECGVDGMRVELGFGQ